MASDARPAPVSGRFPRRPQRGVLLGLSVSRLVMVALAGVIALGGLLAGGLLGLVVLALIWGPLMASTFVRWGGRPAAEWAASSAHYGARLAAGQVNYRSRLPLRPRPAGTMALPGDGASLRFHVDPVSGAALVHDPHRHTLAAVLAVSHPAFVLLDHDDQALRVSRWGHLQAALGAVDFAGGLAGARSRGPGPGRRRLALVRGPWRPRRQLGPTASTGRCSNKPGSARPRTGRRCPWPWTCGRRQKR